MSGEDIENPVFDEPVSRLDKPLDLKDLMEKCADFTIRTSGEDEAERAEETYMAQAYTMEELEPYILTDVLEAASDDDESENPNYDEISRSFPVFRRKMTNLTDDGKVMKMIDHESGGEKVPSEGNIVVYYHYAVYVEFDENPIDCSRLRQKKYQSATLGRGEILPGLEIALRSMRCGERAKFLIHPDLALRSAGAPPRIPPQATLLYDVELHHISADLQEEYVSTRDRTFDECFNLAQKFRAKGNASKIHDKNVNGAISAYKQGLRYLLEATFDTDEDEKRRKKELLHLYTNLAVCYLEKNRLKMVCNTFNDARADCSPDGEFHPKLLYCSGKALRMLGSYEEALRRLRKALRLKPEDESILRELDATLEARQKSQEAEKRTCQQMFGFKDPNDTASLNEDDEALLREVGSDFADDISKMLDFMEETERKSETLNTVSYSYKEKEFIRKTCAKRNFLYKTPSENKIVIIKKSVPS